MAAISEAFMRLRVDSSQVKKDTEKGLKGVNTTAAGKTAGSKFVGGFRAGFAGIKTVAKIAAPAMAAVFGGQAIVAGVKYVANLEQAKVAFTTMLGSGQKATAMISKLQTFAAKTPFNFPELVDASKRLIAFGFNANQVLPTLTAIGDAAAGLGTGAEGVNRITTAIGQMAAKGKVQSDEILQLTEAGVPALRILANQYHVSAGKMQEMITKGVVPANKAIPLLLAGIEKGTNGAAGATTKFGGLMQAQSHTLTGIFSNFVDIANQRLAQLVTPALPYIKNALLALVNLVSGGGPAGAALARFANIVKTTFGPVIVAAIKDFVRFIGQVFSAFANLWPVIAPVAGLVGGALLLGFRLLGAVLATVVGPALKAITGFVRDNSTVFLALGAAVGVVVAAMNAWRVGLAAYTIITNGVRIATTAWTAAQWLLNAALAANPIGLVVIAIAALAAGIAVAWTRSETFRRVVIAGWNAIRNAAVTVWNAVLGAIRAVWDWVRSNWPLLLAVLTGPIGIAVTWIVTHWGTVVAAFQAAGAAIRASFAALGSFFASVGQAIIRPFQAAMSWIAAQFMPWWNSNSAAIKAIWNGLWTAVRAVVGPALALVTAAVQGGFGLIRTVFSTGVAVLTGMWSGLWLVMRSAAQAAWGVISAVVNAGWGMLRAVYNTGVGVLRAVWTGLWAVMQSAARAAWGVIAAVVSGGWAVVRAVFTAVSAVVIGIWRFAWTTIQAVVRLAWTIIANVVRAGWNVLAGIFTVFINLVTGHWSRAWNAIRAMFQQVWNAIVNIGRAMSNTLRTILAAAWNAIRATATAVWNAIRAFFNAWWSSLRAAWSAALNGIRGMLSGAWNAMSGSARAIWNGLRNFFNSWWSGLRGAWSSAVRGIAGMLSGAWNGIRNTAIAVWTGIRNSINNIWNGIKSVIAKPINAVVGFINSYLIGGVDLILSTIGVKGKGPHGGPIPTIPKIPGFRRGGRLPGFGGGDIIPAWIRGGGPAMLEPGEAVVDKYTTRAHAAELGAWGVPGFRKGGRPGNPDEQLPAIRGIYPGTRGDIGWLVFPAHVRGFATGGEVEAKMLQFMTSQVGHPYLAQNPQRFGPQYWDCSGLLWKAAVNAGVPIPQSQALANLEANWFGTSAWARAALDYVYRDMASIRQGDLIFTTGAGPGPSVYGPIGHTGMALNNRQMVSALGRAYGVTVSSISRLVAGIRLGGTNSKMGAIAPGAIDIGSLLSKGLSAAGGFIINTIEDLISFLPGPVGSAVNALLGLTGKAKPGTGTGWVHQLTGGMLDWVISHVVGWARGKAFDALKALFGAVTGTGGGGGAPGAPAGVVSGSGNANLLTIARYLVSQGVSKAAAAGIASVVFGESAGNPESVGSGGFGLIGWTGNTIGLPAGYRGPTGNASKDLAIQMAGIIGYGRASGPWGTLIKMTDPVAAGNLWSRSFERPLVALSDTRPSLARSLFAQLASGGLIKAYDNGGPLSEPVIGIGKSGARYTFEAGEWVTNGRREDAMVRELRALRAVLEQVPGRTAAGVAQAVEGPRQLMAQSARRGGR